MEVSMSCGSYSGTAGQAQSCTPRGPRKGLEIVGIVFGFFYFWPLAAAYLVWKFMGYPIPAHLRETVEQGVSNLFGGFKPFSNARGNSTSFSATGNRAFDDYRRGEIERLEQERRRLDEEARDFRSFVDDLKRAKDREEFDAYMAKRRAS
jgi:hypothetical protein